MVKNTKTKTKPKPKSSSRSVKASSRSSTHKATPAKSTRASSHKATPQTPPPGLPRIELTLDQKLNIVAILMMVIGVLTLISLFTASAGTLPAWWAKVLNTSMGWGAYLLPAVLLGAGIWLLLRKIEQLPEFSTARVLGIILLLCNLLTWFQLIASSNPAAHLLGGGAIGHFFLSTLTRWFGTVGAVIWLIAWLLIALILLINLSMAKVTAALSQAFQGLKEQIVRWQSAQAARKAATLQSAAIAAPQQKSPAIPANHSQPNQQTQPNQPAVVLPAPASAHPWVLPDAEEILNPVVAAAPNNDNDQDRARVIEETLRSFSTPAHVVEIRRGPAITLLASSRITSKGATAKPVCASAISYA